MAWNYRVVEYPDGDDIALGLHEVYYDETGKPYAMSAEPMCIFENNTFAILQILWRIFCGATLKQHFVPPEHWKK